MLMLVQKQMIVVRGNVKQKFVHRVRQAPRKTIAFPILWPWVNFNVGRMATELLNISNPSQATCNVKVLADIVRVNLLLKYLPIDLHTNIKNQVKNRCLASSALVLLIICFFWSFWVDCCSLPPSQQEIGRAHV